MPPKHFKVLSYNIHRGIGLDMQLDLARTAAFIKKTAPDVAALQEVDDRTRRSFGVNQAAKLAELTGMHAFFGRAMDYDGGYYGECILSKFPARRLVVHPLPAESGYEPRALVELEIAPFADSAPIVFFGTHLDHETTERQRMRQVERILEITSRRTDPIMILAGDMNDRPKSRSIVRLCEHWIDAGPSGASDFTFPADRPDHRIDYILHRGPGIAKVVGASIPDEPLVSDHRPVVATFEIAG